MRRIALAPVLMLLLAWQPPGSQPVVWIEDLVILEGSGSGPDTLARFRVTLRGEILQPVQVSWATADLDAVAGLDYEASSGVLVFHPPGAETDPAELVLEVEVGVLADLTPEGSETFLVQLSEAEVEIGKGVGHGVIADDDFHSPRAKCDLDGDGRSNLIIDHREVHDPSRPGVHEGQIKHWGVIGTIATPGSTGSLDSGSWHVLTTADFDGDGSCNLLWQEQTAARSGPRLAVTTISVEPSSLREPLPSEVLAVTPLDPSWQAVGAGDFNADGRADVLWWNGVSGELSVWLADGAGFPESGRVLLAERQADLSWWPEAVANLAGGAATGADIVWRHLGSGELVYWQMENLKLAAEGALEPPLAEDFKLEIVGAGDFDGDGQDDLLWQHAGSQKTRVWLMDGTVRRAGSALSPDTFGRTDGVPDWVWSISGPR